MVAKAQFYVVRSGPEVEKRLEPGTSLVAAWMKASFARMGAGFSGNGNVFWVVNEDGESVDECGRILETEVSRCQ